MNHATTTEYLFAAANLALCIAIAGVCLCRLRLTSLHTRAGVRVKYSGLGGAALVFGLSPWTGEWPGWTGCAFAAAVLVGLLTSRHRWGEHPPPEPAQQRRLLTSVARQLRTANAQRMRAQTDPEGNACAEHRHRVALHWPEVGHHHRSLERRGLEHHRREPARRVCGWRGRHVPGPAVRHRKDHHRHL